MIGEILTIGYTTFFIKKINGISNFKSGSLFELITCLIAQFMVMQMMSVTNVGSFASGLFSGLFMIAIASLV